MNINKNHQWHDSIRKMTIGATSIVLSASAAALMANQVHPVVQVQAATQASADEKSTQTDPLMPVMNSLTITQNLVYGSVSMTDQVIIQVNQDQPKTVPVDGNDFHFDLYDYTNDDLITITLTNNYGKKSTPVTFYHTDQTGLENSISKYSSLENNSSFDYASTVAQNNFTKALNDAETLHKIFNGKQKDVDTATKNLQAAADALIESERKSDAVLNPVKLPKEKVPVDSMRSLTDKEQSNVSSALRSANPTWPKGVKLSFDIYNPNYNNFIHAVFPDGSAQSIPFDQVVTLDEAATATFQYPDFPIVVKNDDELSNDEIAEAEAALKAANPMVKSVEYNNFGEFLLTYKDGSTKEIYDEGKLYIELPYQSNVSVTPPTTKIKVQNPKQLTSDEKQQLKNELQDLNPDASTVEISDQGLAKLGFDNGKGGLEYSFLGPDELIQRMADFEHVNLPSQKIVKPLDLDFDGYDSTTPAVIQAQRDLEASNPNLKSIAKFVIDSGKQTIDVEFEDGSVKSIPFSSLIATEAADSRDKYPDFPVIVKDVNHLTAQEKDSLLKTVQSLDPQVVSCDVVYLGGKNRLKLTYADKSSRITSDSSNWNISDLPKWLITFPYQGIDSKYQSLTAVNAPSKKITAKDPEKLTETEKTQLKSNIITSNPQLADHMQITISDQGLAKIAFDYPEDVYNYIAPWDLITNSTDESTPSKPEPEPTPEPVTPPAKPATPTPKKPVTPAKPKTPQKTATSVAFKGIVKVTAGSTTVYTAPGGKATSQVLKQGTRWQVTHYEIIDGQKWYQVGTNQWVLAGDAAVEGKSSDVSSLTETKLRAVAKVTYKGTGSVRLLDRSGHYQNSYVKKQTSWKVFAQATINGKLYYRLGNQRQWIPAQYVKLTRA